MSPRGALGRAHVAKTAASSGYACGLGHWMWVTSHCNLSKNVLLCFSFGLAFVVNKSQAHHTSL